MNIRIEVKNRYLVLTMGMIIQLCAGIIYMWSVFKEPVSAHLAWNPASASITSSFMLSAFVLGTIAGGYLQDKYTPTPIALLGSVLLGLGMIFSAFTPQSNPWLIYIFYGIIGGFGVGCVYTATVSVVQKWFPDKRGFATGMMVGAFGFSLVLFVPVTKLLLASWGVPTTFTFLGILFLIICSFCSLFICNPQTTGQSIAATAVSTQRQYTTSEMLKTKNFYLLTLSLFFILPTYFILNPLFISLGVDRGLTENMAALGVMITGVASASGRLITPWVSDFIGRKAGILITAFLTFVSALVMIFAEGTVFLICITVIAFSLGSAASVYAATTADLFGTKHMGLNYGCVMIGFGLSVLIFPLVSNVLASTGVYTYSFLLAAATCVITFILVMFLKIPKHTQQKV
ncbi:MFS transporter [Selenomonadales bacterium OttesenSCG-928-I06]|nr:MFS transporter [Selenomonadales bacterium OttesenSCG-928-I06]